MAWDLIIPNRNAVCEEGKMNKGNKGILLTSVFAAVLGLIICFAAYGELIQGEIVEIDTKGNTLNISRSDPVTGAAEPENIRIQVHTDTKYEGVIGIEELRIGDEVWAEVIRNEEADSWSAKNIKIDKVNIRDQKEVKEENKVTT